MRAPCAHHTAEDFNVEILPMRRSTLSWTIGTLLLTFAVCSSAPAAEIEQGFTSMFNGQDLTGWDGKPGWWFVEDGAITAQSTPQKPCTQCNYLIWRGGKPGDFELRTTYRLIDGNSGIQFRSRELPDWDTSGYQADMEAGDQWTGCLFEHVRGGVAMRGQKVVINEDGKKQISALGDSKELLTHIKKDDWNEYRVIARGSDITLEINGVVMTQVSDNEQGKAAKDGIIAFQMHPGPPMKVQFKNLRIKIFDLPAPAAGTK
jgi:Domain of Unknown Function (DUF1080)